MKPASSRIGTNTKKLKIINDPGGDSRSGLGLPSGHHLDHPINKCCLHYVYDNCYPIFPWWIICSPLKSRNLMAILIFRHHMKLVTSPMKFPNHIYIFITLHHYFLFLLLKVLEVGCRPPHPSTSGSRWRKGEYFESQGGSSPSTAYFGVRAPLRIHGFYGFYPQLDEWHILY